MEEFAVSLEEAQSGGSYLPELWLSLCHYCRALDCMSSIPIFCTIALTPSAGERIDRVPLLLALHPTGLHIQRITLCHFCQL